jgi:glycosyltransferase involved in cell wall biosynthesis
MPKTGSDGGSRGFFCAALTQAGDYSMISVCMAVFNGELYLEQQLRSILVQLSADDEVIIVDDCSRDRSEALIRGMQDSRILFLRNEINIGPSASFARAISNAKGRYIFLSDQDDIWNSNKVATICQIFDSTKSLVIVSDARIVDSNCNVLFESLFALRRSRPGFWHNLYKNGFVGCCMALRSEAKAFFLPFPDDKAMHDEWIGLCASIAGEVTFTPNRLIDYRRHEKNATQLGHGSLMWMVSKRIKFSLYVLQRLPRILAWRFRMHE